MVSLFVTAADVIASDVDDGFSDVSFPDSFVVAVDVADDVIVELASVDVDGTPVVVVVVFVVVAVVVVVVAFVVVGVVDDVLVVVGVALVVLITNLQVSSLILYTLAGRLTKSLTWV